MESFEHLMKRLYQERKKDEEAAVPDFDSVVFGPRKARPVRGMKAIWKLASSTAAAAITALVIWKAVGWDASKKRQVALDHQPYNHYATAATDGLLRSAHGLTTIWDWKSPTDELLNLHHKAFNNKKQLQ